ncbi:MAG: bifunctional diguanylate cyclase/phosphodiesterase [Treponema sp.]|nr:bifunctional diguanylate cyclase/phosphodiesterase [Treponema sp.]
MIKINSRKGRHLSWLCISISLTLLTMAFIRMKSETPIPGFFMILLFSLMATMMSYQIELLDKRMVADYVTSLNNSRGLILTLNKKIYDNESFYVIYIELENFKSINDNYGFDFGDELRKLVTKRIKFAIKGHGVAGCIDRSSFMIVLNGDCDAKQVCAGIIRSIGEKIAIKKDGVEIDCYLTSYAGISSCPKDSSDAETLMKQSDIAMYHASIAKKDRIVFFDSSMETKIKRQVEVEKIVKRALANNHFYLVYQPQFSTQEKKLRGFEALLRLKEPNGIELSPTEFIPAAEKNDLILEITDWVLENLLASFAEHVKGKDIVISMNVSAKNMESEDFVKKVREALAKTSFPAKNLEIEITEYCLLGSFEQTIENIKALRAIGVKVALDDFGTGYSSLSYLEKLPINILKIDKSLVDGIETDRKNQQFVSAVVYMGHLMGCEVVCEGVESQGQLKLLRENNSDFIQGFIWSKPLEFEKALDLLKS